MKKIEDVYQDVSKEELINSGYNWGTEDGEFEEDLENEERVLSSLGYTVEGWVVVKDGIDIPEIKGEPGSYLLKLNNGNNYGMVMDEVIVVNKEKLLKIINR